jgi:hypothetical protein
MVFLHTGVSKHPDLYDSVFPFEDAPRHGTQLRAIARHVLRFVHLILPPQRLRGGRKLTDWMGRVRVLGIVSADALPGCGVVPD